MGNDYAARTNAKKLKKRNRQEAGRDGKPNRERKNKKGPRSMCRGVCYKQPELSEKDKKWNGQPDYEEEEEDRDEQVADQIVTQDEDVKKKSRKRKAESEPEIDTPKLSTEVKLLDLQTLLSQAKTKTLSKLPTGASVEALETFHPVIQSFMLSQGFVEPTPIQSSCWNDAVSGKDVLGVAEPGSGKTLAYLLPGFVKLKESAPVVTEEGAPGPRMLVLLPTRELAMQVGAVCRSARGATGLRTVHVYGGMPREGQIEQLKTLPDVVVGTPGRLLDLFDTKDLRLDNVRYVVLDEADKMLSLGFQQQIQRLYRILLESSNNAPVQKADGLSTEEEAGAPVSSEGKAKNTKKGKKAKLDLNGSSQQKDSNSVEESVVAPQPAAQEISGGPLTRPQVLLFTATLPEDVVVTSGAWLKDAVSFKISTSSAAVSSTVTQIVHVCAEHKKPAKLLKHLEQVKEQGAKLRNPPRVLIFCNKIKTVRFLNEALGKEGFRSVMLHGDRSQSEREAAVRDFRGGKAQILVATDVAARGLDVRALPYVVNYDFPSRLETYIHRIGRTGRLAAYGHAYSFFTRNLAKIAVPLQLLLTEHKQHVDPNLLRLAEEWRSEEAEMQSAAALLNLPELVEGEDDGDVAEEDVEHEEDGTGGEKEKKGPTKKEKRLAEKALKETQTKNGKKAEEKGKPPGFVAEDLLEGLGLPALLSQTAADGSSASSTADVAVADGNVGTSTVTGKRRSDGKVVQILNQNDELVPQPARTVPKLELDPPSLSVKRKKTRAGDMLLVPSEKHQQPNAAASPGVTAVPPSTKESSKKAKGEEANISIPKANGAAKAAAPQPQRPSEAQTLGQPEVPVYLASKQFVGAKPGTVFKLGKQGLGYYRDAVALAKLAANGSAAGGPKQQQNKKQQRQEKAMQKQADATVAASKPLAVAKQQTRTIVGRNKPIVPAHTGDTDSGSGSDDDGWGSMKEELQVGTGDLTTSSTATASKKRARKDDHDDDSDSGDDRSRKGSGGNKSGKKANNKRKALPGRLRKNLKKKASLEMPPRSRN